MTQLASTKPTKFTDVPPGSRIQVTDAKNPMDQFNGIALDVIAEYGPNRVPAISFMREGSDEVEMLSGSGRWSVTVLTSSAGLAALVSTIENVVTASLRPATVRALRFDGTVDSGRDCILFTSGLAAIRFEPNNEPPRLLLGGVNPTPVMPGDYVVIETRNADDKETHIVTTMSGNDFATSYEVL
jgi:hypothetical protein